MTGDVDVGPPRVEDGQVGGLAVVEDGQRGAGAPQHHQWHQQDNGDQREAALRPQHAVGGRQARQLRHRLLDLVEEGREGAHVVERDQRRADGDEVDRASQVSVHHGVKQTHPTALHMMHTLHHPLDEVEKPGHVDEEIQHVDDGGADGDLEALVGVD